MGNRVYDLEFQKEAVRLLHKRDGKVTMVARSLGIPVTTLKTWDLKMGKSIKIDKTKHTKSKDERILELEEENCRLRKENTNFQEDNDILKKSISIFLKRPLT